MDAGTDAALTSLGDPTRARILRLMRSSPEGRVLVGRLASELGLRQPTVSHHMKTLLTDGIVTREPEGRQVWYSVAPDAADRVDAILGRPREVASVDLDRIVSDLATRFGDRVDPARVRDVVTDSHARLSETDAPLLASRTFSFAASRFEALAEASAVSAGTPPSVLFVCVQNAGRSQLAAGILRHLAGDAVTVRTAGSAPTSDVRSTIVTALDEIGVSIGDEFPKPLTDEAVWAADVVITMGCGDACPIYPGTRYLDWDLEDPVGRPLAAVRGIRDDIDQRVRGLLAELRIPATETVNTR